MVLDHRPLMALYTCPLKAGRVGTTILIFHVLTNFIMLLVAHTNTYLDSCNNKYGDRAAEISKIFKQIYIFLSGTGLTT